MINNISLRLYSLQQKIKKNRTLLWIIIATIALMGLQLCNVVLMHLLGLNNTAWPWSFIEVMSYGFFVPIIIALTTTYTPIIAGVFWLLGGVKRAIAQRILLVWVAVMCLSTLAVYVFSLWEGLNLTSTPWLAYSFWVRLPSDSMAFNHLLMCLMASYSLLFFAFVLKCFSTQTKAEKVFGQAHFSNAFEIQRAGLFSHQGGVVLGRAYGQILRLPGYESVLVVAPTGSGKTTAIAVPNLIEWQGSGVFNDLKGELYNLTADYRKRVLNNDCYLWAPADEQKQTVCYNPFFYVSSNPNLRIRDLQLIAEILIPATKLGEGFWYQSSREIFLTLALYCFETNGIATLSKIHDLSKQHCFFEWLETELVVHEDIFSKYLKQNTNAILGADKKTQKNILKDFHSRMSVFIDPLVGYATSKNDFDFRQLRRKKMSVYVHIPDSDKERLSPILTLFWAQLINTVSSHEPQKNERYGILALMDEFGNMARINKLKEGMSFLRAYNMRCIIIVQYLGQITSIYGRDDAKGFLNSKVKIAFASNDMDDAQFFSKALGTRTVRVSSSSVNTGHDNRSGSRSESRSFRSRPLLSSDEIMQLSQDKSIILIESRSPIKVDKCYWFKNPRYWQLLNNYPLTTNVKEESHESQ